MEPLAYILTALLGLALGAGTMWCRSRRQSNHRGARDDQPPAKQAHLVEVSRLVGGLAHEIKNPLSTMNLNLRLLQEDVEKHSDETHQRWARRLRNVQAESDRLKGILDDFLRFAGKLELHRSNTDLVELIHELTDFFQPQAEASRVVLRTHLPDQAVICKVDADLFKQALLNLILNAVDAMAEGGELLIRLSAGDDEAVIEVIDTGQGIAPEIQEKVFEIYYSTKKSGSGIGLPMTRRLIQEHGGSIELHSEPGKGTRFTIHVPRNNADDDSIG
jgi:two-component system, NtrC family, sensor histidine kinase HydH